MSPHLEHSTRRSWSVVSGGMPSMKTLGLCGGGGGSGCIGALPLSSISCARRHGHQFQSPQGGPFPIGCGELSLWPIPQTLSQKIPRFSFTQTLPTHFLHHYPTEYRKPIIFASMRLQRSHSDHLVHHHHGSPRTTECWR
jgi:hypothetical protein